MADTDSDRSSLFADGVLVMSLALHNKQNDHESIIVNSNKFRKVDTHTHTDKHARALAHTHTHTQRRKLRNLKDI